MGLLDFLNPLSGIARGAETVAGIVERYHADSAEAANVAASIRQQGEAVQADLAKSLVKSGRWYELAPVIAWEWLRTVALGVVIFDLARGGNSGLLQAFGGLL